MSRAEQPGREDGPDTSDRGTPEPETIKSVVVATLSSVLFFLSLTLFEAIPEIPVDIDFKPFFVPLAFVSLLPWGRPTVAAAMGASLGEGLRDLLEGYEIDDPIGAVAYVVGFVLAGWIVKDHPTSRPRLLFAGLAAGASQAALEASSFLIFGGVGVPTAIGSAAGNTLTHGLLLGALPLLWIVPRLHGRIEGFFGYPPRGQPTGAS